MAELDISLIVGVSLSAAPATLGFYSPNTLMIISSDTPTGSFTGSFGYYYDLKSVGTDWGTTSNTYKVASMVFAQSPNILSAGGCLYIAPKATQSETMADAITRLYALTYFAGVMGTVVATDYTAEAVVAQGLDLMLFAPSNDPDAFTDGTFGDISSGSYTHTKPLYYGGSEAIDALEFAGAYASRAMCVDFTAQNSTLTMNMKDIAGLTPDSTITAPLYNTAKTLGVDIYPSVGGLGKVISNPIANLFFDDVYNQTWFKKRIQVAIFNGLAGTRNKIPQTGTGMNYLKNAAREVCALGVYNGFLAAGKWNSADTFGNPDDFRRNISEFGYFVYSLPITRQAQADRQARKAPVMQIAGKEAGAIHSANIIIYIEQ